MPYILPRPYIARDFRYLVRRLTFLPAVFKGMDRPCIDYEPYSCWVGGLYSKHGQESCMHVLHVYVNNNEWAIYLYWDHIMHAMRIPLMKLSGTTVVREWPGTDVASIWHTKCSYTVGTPMNVQWWYHMGSVSKHHQGLCIFRSNHLLQLYPVL